MFTSQSPSLKKLIDTNFLEYASYVIKERAIPFLEDGLKPVQRRILHTLFEVDDGKFHKVANIVGHTMRYHPHGDASIEAALVNMAQKDYFIDKQGNFGNILTGDPASAARYIECRLTDLARDTLFNPEITQFNDSYDGRNKEPVVLPSKLPVLLMSGVEGIAVGLSTRLLPHNFSELLHSQIAILKGQPFKLYPDFIQGGVIDIANYQAGKGKVRVRAKIEKKNDKILVIKELPYGTTTESLIASIEKAIHDGKLKISSINDFTTDTVEIELKMGHGVKADNLIPRLFLYTDCEKAIHLQPFVIHHEQPIEMNVNQILQANTDELVGNLKLELEFDLAKLQKKHRAMQLARIFIEEKIYQHLENADSLNALKSVLREQLTPHTQDWTPEVSDDELDKLLNIPIRRISRHDSSKAEKEIKAVEKEIRQIKKYLKAPEAYAIEYLETLIEKYGAQYPRRTTIESFDTIDVTEVAIQDIRVGFDAKTNYLGTGVKTDNPMLCSTYDKLLVLYKKGIYKVIDIPEKLFFQDKVKKVVKQSEQPTVSVIYRENKSQTCYMKRFVVTKFILDREYQYIPDNSELLFFSIDPDPIVKLEFSPKKRARVTEQVVDFAEMMVKGVAARGNMVTKREIVGIKRVKRDKNPETASETVASEHTPASESETDKQPLLPQVEEKRAQQDTSQSEPIQTSAADNWKSALKADLKGDFNPVKTNGNKDKDRQSHLDFLGPNS